MIDKTGNNFTQLSSSTKQPENTKINKQNEENTQLFKKIDNPSSIKQLEINTNLTESTKEDNQVKIKINLE